MLIADRKSGIGAGRDNMQQMGMTACQVRMARAALRWSIEELATHSGVSEKTIRRIEKVFGVPPSVTTETMRRLHDCFLRQGLTLLMEDGGPDGPGVRFGRYPGRMVWRAGAIGEGATEDAPA